MCLKKSRSLEGLICSSCIKGCWGNSTTKNYRHVKRPTMESNLNHSVFEYHRKCDLFSDFHYGFRSSRSTLDLLTSVPDKTARAFDRSAP